MRSSAICALAVLLCVGQARAAIVVPGFSVAVYADVPSPVRLSFAPSGDLYAGSTGDPARISRISPGGTAVVQYGADSLHDPDAVLFDTTGGVSGTPGAVLVAGGWQEGTSLIGQVSAILPDESVVPVFGPSTTFFNINDMEFDMTGRLLAADAGFGQVLVSNGGDLETLITTSTAAQSLAVDSTNRIFLSGYDGTIRIYDSSGNLIDDAFATGLSVRPELAFGPGGAFGEYLYVLDSGNLLRIDSAGIISEAGSGFELSPGNGDLRFGPDNALYISETEHGRVLRIAAIPEPSAIIVWSLLGTLAITVGWWRRRR